MTPILLDCFKRYSSLAEPQRGKEEILSSGHFRKHNMGSAPKSNQPPVASR
jgi:hypothetical protein